MKIDYRGIPAALKDLIGCACIIGVVGMLILVCMYCPSLPDTSYQSSDDDFMTGFMWGMYFDDCGSNDWGVGDCGSDDDYFGGCGIVS